MVVRRWVSVRGVIGFCIVRCITRKFVGFGTEACQWLLCKLRQKNCGFFFFQAEDGIRDSSVTGVQTCALPICSTWGTSQEQAPPTATYCKNEIVPTTSQENGKVTIRNENVKRYINLPVDASRIQANMSLNYHQKGLLWYSTYVVDYAGDYKFRNDSGELQTVAFRLPFPAQTAVYDSFT